MMEINVSKIDCTPRIVIVTGMEVEAKVLRNRLKDHRFVEEDFRRFEMGVLDGVAVVLTVTGPGKVNAAMTLQSALTHFQAVQVIFSGVSGGLQKTKIGDIVVSSDACYHDYGIWGATGISRFNVTVKFPPSHDRVRIDRFSADAPLADIVMNVARNIQWPPLPYASAATNVYMGTISTGDQFIASNEKSIAIAEATGALAVDMETAAIAQVAMLNEVPFVAVRTISDRADKPAEIDFNKFVNAAAERSAAIISHLMGEMSNYQYKETLIASKTIHAEPRPIIIKLECTQEESAIISSVTGQAVESLELTALDLRRILTPESELNTTGTLP